MALIYIVEDNANIREIETIALQNSGYTVETFDHAASFYQKLEMVQPDLIILDIMLPDESGYNILSKLRNRPMTRNIPIMMVTAKTQELDLVRGLENGADDYLKKPFSVMEFISRVKALLRRTAKDDLKCLELEEIRIDQSRHVVYANEKQIELTFKEYELLRLLMVNMRVVLSRENIMIHVWGTDFEGESRTVDMHIKTLRQKLGESGKHIRTVRNVGYVIE